MQNDTNKNKKSGNTELELFSQLRDICLKAGIRLTHQRLEVFKEIMSAKDHPAAEDIYERLKERMPTISLDTVYRTLGTFERLGVIRKMHVLDDHARFDPNTERHHHFVCTKCKKIIDFEWPAFDTLKLPSELNTYGTILEQQVEVRGLCKECGEKSI